MRRKYLHIAVVTYFIIFCGFAIQKPNKVLNCKTVIFLDTVKKDTVILDSLRKDSITLDSLSKKKYKLLKSNTQASHYHHKFNGRKTASGQVFSNNKYTAAHKNLKFGSKVRVTNLANGKSVIVTINDRGPFTKGRDIDLAKKPFMDITHNGGKTPLRVKLELIIEE